MSERRVILVTSAPPKRPEYKRDFLTCVAAPDLQRVAFSYSRHWIEPALLDAGLAGRAATVVFCDRASPTSSEYDFHAFRHAKIDGIVPPSTGDLPDSAAITVEFTLKGLVRSTAAELPQLRKEWDRTLRSLPHRPRPPTGDGEDRWYVFEHDALAEGEEDTDQMTSWRALSEDLGKCPSLSEAFFFRIGSVQKLGDGQGAAKALVPRALGPLRRVFDLAPSAEYEVPMDAYSGSGKNPYSEAIDAKSSSTKLSVQALTQSSAGRASQASLVVLAGEVNRAQIATLIICGAPKFEHQVPRVELAMRIKPNKALQIVLAVLIAAGVFMGGLSSGDLGLSEGLAFALKGGGSLLTGAIALVALGRAPGVGG